ncbi:hypothetical protein OESDEN_16640 [Oesophagostomum dentatum]|uniref:SHSP domain-containing protein n=1 Tax=Oesophagostomum dentatum TaxID=61180 RepID=A0A0B1SEF4_OESDE|nr:hypothetical protein OESDEN_16640 [Oesophagostomum dentatum]
MAISPYTPEELRVYLIGRDLIVEGNQEKLCPIGYVQMSFSRRWSLPGEVDLDAVDYIIDEFEILSIMAPKTGLQTMRSKLETSTPRKSENGKNNNLGTAGVV